MRSLVLIVAIVAVNVLTGCGPSAPDRMTVRQWSQLEQPQRTAAIAELMREDAKSMAGECERHLSRYLAVVKPNPKILDSRLGYGVRHTCAYFQATAG